MHVAQAPEGVAIGHGFAYVADSAGNVIRAVGLAQTIATRRLETVVAGTGAAVAGDGGPATSALLNHPEGLAVDAAGNLFIADTGNNRIRRVTAAGTITTVAGNGVFGYSGDGGPATAAHLANPTAVAVTRPATSSSPTTTTTHPRSRDRRHHHHRRRAGFAGYTGDGGPATAATLNGPAGVAVDAAGDLYIADAGNNAVREVSPQGRSPRSPATARLILRRQRTGRRR